MPSPIAHLAAGYIIYRMAQQRELQPPVQTPEGRLGLLLLAGSFSLLPDVDSAIGLLLQDFGRYHNNATHSLLVGATIAFSCAALMKWRTKQFGFWFAFFLACYSLHILMDAATWGRGVMALWPLSEQRFLSPVLLFYGLHWSEGLLSASHLITIATELIFAAVILLPWWGWSRHILVRQ